MDNAPDVFSTLLATIDERLGAAPAAPQPPAGRDALRQRLTRLRHEGDRVEAELHSHVNQQPVTYGEASFCAECGEAAPCPTIRELLARYAPDDVSG